MIIKPRVRGFICVTTHPAGCEANVKQQIDYVEAKGPVVNGPKKVLVIGSSTGYGLAARITAAFGSGADTLGVFFERPGSEEQAGHRRLVQLGGLREVRPRESACMPAASMATLSPTR